MFKRLSTLFSLCLILMPLVLTFAHEGHHHEIAEIQHKQIEWVSHTPSTFIRWFGNFHMVFLHFPIALIVMTAICEIIFTLYPQLLLDHAARFMIISAAITAIPTVFFGLILGFYSQYGGILESFFWWHRFLGICVCLLAILTAYLRECSPQIAKSYYSVSLALLFLLVCVTSFLGGSLAFGLDSLAMWP